MNVNGIQFDHAREARIGLPEAVYCAGKSSAQLSEIIAPFRVEGRALFLTRLESEAHAALASEDREVLDYDPVSRTAWINVRPISGDEPRVAVVTAGSTDLAVAREAGRTLAFHGAPHVEIADVGVAGIWRLMEREEEIRAMDVVIAVAGMEGALFSVLGGLAGGVVIAVPTSNGYGVAEGGRTALDSALASCAPGVVVTNIDNGYGAACAALRVLRARG